MANRVKEDEKNERIIRNLLKLPENRRCINCNSLGPQYVCTNFSTFICTTCSGIHREFTHRVKSVSMAKFTLQEVSALQGGGNASAREIYLKEWDAQRNALPDGSNVESLRDFIKHVYVDRRYTGERNLDKPLREKMGEPEVSSGKRTDTYQSGSRSPPYEDTFDRRYGDMRSPGGRSPGYDQDNRRNNDYRSPVRAELVNDWRREDRFGNGRKSEDRNSDGGSKLEARSPDSQRDSDMSSPPMVRPVRDILGDNVSPLRVIEPPKPIAGKSVDGSMHTQRTASSSSLASSDGKPAEVKVEASLIDFDSVPEPPITAATEASVVQLTSSSNNNWANFDPMPAVKVHTAVSSSVESILSELSISAPVSAPSSGGSKDPSLESFFGSAAPPSVLPSAGASATSLGPPPHLANAEGSLFPNITMGGLWSNLKPENHPVFPGVVGQPVPQLTTAATDGSLSNKEVINLDFQQPWNAPVGSNVHEPSGAYIPQGTADAKPTMGASFGSGIESTSDPKSVGRKELPEDLFTANYPWAPFPVSGWYSSSPYVAQVPMQYKMPMSAPALPNFQAVSRSTNPFDFGGGPTSVQASTFPSVAPLQGALPKVATPSGPLHHAASLGAPQSHPPSIFTQAPSYPSAIPPSSYVGQEVVGSMTRSEGLSGFSIEEPSAFVSINPNYQLGGLHPAPSGSSNPFG